MNKHQNSIDKNLFISLLLLLLIVFSSTFLRIKMIENALPYPGGVDEIAINVAAKNILQKGDFNPHFFRYPSLPIYLTAVGFTIGYVNAASHLEVNHPDDIGRVTYPFFSQPRIVGTAKKFFAILSVIALIFLGVTAYRLYGNPSLLFLAPFILMLSTKYFLLSHLYLNVDILGCFFILALYTYQTYSFSTDTLLRKAIIPGILTGLTIACKYNLFLIFVPSFLVILFYAKQKILKYIVLVLTGIVVFFIVVPYSLLDFSTFLHHIGKEIYHYKEGHLGHEDIPGISQLIHYLKDIVSDFGYRTFFLVIVGLFFTFKRDRKKALIFMSFPSAFLVYMSLQKVHFYRNLISLWAMYALFAAIGIVELYKLGRYWASKSAFFKDSLKKQHLLTIVVLGCLLFLLFPIGRVIKWINTPGDSRNLVVEWIEKNIDKESTIVIPMELGVDVLLLEKNYQINLFSFKDVDENRFNNIITSYSTGYFLIPTFTYDPHRTSSNDGKIVAKKWNQWIKSANFKIFKMYEGHNVYVNRFEMVPSGNPRFFVGQPQPNNK